MNDYLLNFLIAGLFIYSIITYLLAIVSLKDLLKREKVFKNFIRLFTFLFLIVIAPISVPIALWLGNQSLKQHNVSE